MTLRLRRVGILSVALITGTTGLVLGVLVGLLYAVMMVMFSMIGMATGDRDMARLAGVFVGMGMVMVVLVPLIYGMMAFLAGALLAGLFNLIAPRLGGLEMRFDEPAAALPPPT